MGPMKGCGALKTAMKNYKHAEKILETHRMGEDLLVLPYQVPVYLL